MIEEDEDKLIFSFAIPFAGKEICVYAKKNLTRKDYVIVSIGFGIVISGFCISFSNPIVSLGALISTLGLYELGKIFGLVNEC